MTRPWTDVVLGLAQAWGRAPSAHNTQPGELSIDGDGLAITWDPTRELVVADPTRRDLWLSLGAFAESVVLAAADQGVALRVEWDIDGHLHRAGHLLRVTGSPEPPLFSPAQLLARRTARGPYTDAVMAAEDLERIAHRAGFGAPPASPPADPPTTDVSAGTVAAASRRGGTRLTLLPRGLAADLLPVADAWSYGTGAQVDELRSWLRLSASHPAYEIDGLTDAALALTRSEAAALRVALDRRVWGVLGRVGGPRLMALASREDALGSVAALDVPAHDASHPERVAEAGRDLLRTWLAAAEAGWDVHPLSQLIDCPLTGPAIDEAIGEQRRALSVFRIGVAQRRPARSHRRPR